VHDVHAKHHPAERGESHPVEPAVVTVVDEKLRGAGARAAGRKAHHAARVVLAHRVVRDACVTPRRRHVWIAVNPELRHESRDHPEEPAVIVVTALHQVVEAVGAERRPVAMNLDHEVPRAGLETGAERVRSALPHGRTRGVVKVGRARRGRGGARALRGPATRDHKSESEGEAVCHDTKINSLARRNYPVLRRPWAMPLSVDARPALTAAMVGSSAEALGPAAWERCNNATWSSDSGSTYGLRRPIAVCSIGLSRIR